MRLASTPAFKLCFPRTVVKLSTKSCEVECQIWCWKAAGAESPGTLMLLVMSEGVSEFHGRKSMPKRNSFVVRGDRILRNSRTPVVGAIICGFASPKVCGTLRRFSLRVKRKYEVNLSENRWSRRTVPTSSSSASDAWPVHWPICELNKPSFGKGKPLMNGVKTGDVATT